MPNGVKTRFAGLLRELLRRFDENETGAGAPQAPRPLAGATTPPPAVPVSQVLPQAGPVFPPAASRPKPTPSENVTEVELPLSLVLENLPPRLRLRVTLDGADLTNATISISVGKIIPQLSAGAVKITFGELRQAAPTLFNIDEEYDSLPVVLPLNEILARINPSALNRNPSQKTIAVPEDITGPFSNGGEGISISTTPLKPASAPATPPIRMASPPARTVTTPPPVAQPPPAFVSRSIVPERPVSPLPRNGNGNGNGAPATPIIPTFPLPLQQNPLRPAAARPIPMPAAVPPPPKPMEATMPVSLALLMENWPEPLRMEIAPLASAGATVELPVSSVESALKRGRVTFAWRNLRSWIKPQAPTASVRDNLDLELPLKVIAPLFLSRLGGKTAQPRQSRPLPNEIPNLFFGFPQPQPQTIEPPVKLPSLDEAHYAPTPAKARQDTNFFSAEPETSFAARPTETEFKRQPAMPVPSATPATDFSTRFAPPREIVSRAMALGGVAGAIVALPDGLMVASEIPAQLNAETLAAFLPQIYGRVTQCTKELRMGDLNNLNFTVGNVPWKIFRIHGVYFAAFGRAGQQLPTAQLAQLAAELDRKK